MTRVQQARGATRSSAEEAKESLFWKSVITWLVRGIGSSCEWLPVGSIEGLVRSARSLVLLFVRIAGGHRYRRH